MGRKVLRPGALLSPAPAALVSCGAGDKINLITVAWCGIVCTKPPMTYISIRPERYSYHLIKESGEFVINLTNEALCRAADYCGMYTGEKVNKFEKCKLTPIPSQEVSAPTLAEAPLSLECRVSEIKPLGSHDMFLSEIVSVTVREELLDEAGKICLEKAGLISYSHGEYYALGRRLGKFGFSATKKKKKPNNRTKK